MNKKILQYPTTYLIVILILYTVYDYFEHIGRSGSSFEANPGDWLLFNIAAVLSFVLVVLTVKITLQRIFDRSHLLIEVIAIGIWLAAYLTILGPLIDQLFWPPSELLFRFSLIPFMILIGGYFIMRLLINLLIGKKAFYSK